MRIHCLHCDTVTEATPAVVTVGTRRLTICQCPFCQSVEVLPTAAPYQTARLNVHPLAPVEIIRTLAEIIDEASHEPKQL